MSGVPLSKNRGGVGATAPKRSRNLRETPRGPMWLPEVAQNTQARAQFAIPRLRSNPSPWLRGVEAIQV